MAQALATATLALLVAGILVVATLALRRLHLAREDARRRDAEERMQEAALLLVDGEDPDLPPLSDDDAQALARLLSRFAHLVDGTAKAQIAHFFASRGHVVRQAQTLHHRVAWRRASAAYALGDMGPSAIIPLLDALGDSHRAVRSAAARSLGRLGSEAAAKPLARALAVGAVPRLVAGDAMLAIGPAAITPLGHLVNDDDPRVRAASVELIGLVGANDEDRAELVVSRLGDVDTQVRAAAAAALGRLGAETATRALRAALHDPEPDVRTRAAEALGAMGDRSAARALARQARNDAHAPALAAAEALAQIDPLNLAKAATDPTWGPYIAQAADVDEVRAS